MSNTVQPTPEPQSSPENDEQAAVRRSVDRAFPAVAAFLAEGQDARPDADLMRVDAPQVSGPRTTTFRARAVRRLWRLADRLRAYADTIDDVAVTVQQFGQREGRWTR